MKFLFIFIFFSGFSLSAQATAVAHYTYLKAKKPVKKTLLFKDVKRAYAVVKQNTFTPPSPQEFFRDFLPLQNGCRSGLK